MRLWCEDFAAAENNTVMHSCHYHTFPHPTSHIKVVFHGPIPRLFPAFVMHCTACGGKSEFSSSSSSISSICISLLQARDNQELALTPGMSKIPGKRLLQLGTRDNQELALTPGMSKIPGKRLLQLGTQTAANANCMGSIPYTIFSAKDKPSSSKLENQYPILTTHGSPFGRVEFLLQHTYPRALCHPVFQWWQERHPMTSLDLPPLLQSCTR